MFFGEKLKRLRKANHLIQEELDFKFSVSRQAITKWKCGDEMPNIENLKQNNKRRNWYTDKKALTIKLVF